MAAHPGALLVTIEDALHQILAPVTEIAALVGEPDLIRIFRGVAPQGSRAPYLVLQRTSTTGVVGQCGTAGTEFALVQIDTYAKTEDERDALARAVFLTLRDFSGTIGTLKIKAATRQNEFDLDDPEPGLYRRSQSWALWYIETA